VEGGGRKSKKRKHTVLNIKQKTLRLSISLFDKNVESPTLQSQSPTTFAQKKCMSREPTVGRQKGKNRGEGVGGKLTEKETI
jgi:hypothetical protein